jgi:integrase
MMENKTEYVANLAYPFLGAVFKYMNSSGVPINNPFPSLKKSMVLEGEYKTEGLDSIKDPKIMKQFLRKLKDVKNLPIARNCVLAIAYLPLRPMEMCTLKFSDIIENGSVLYIPPTRNKTKKHLYFPVTRQLESIIKYQRTISGGEYVFPNRIGGEHHIKRDALTRVVEQIGFRGQLDIHGLRHTFRTIADEHLKLDRLMLEVVLGHNVGSRIENVYNRSTYMDQKLDVLIAWNNWMDA